MNVASCGTGILNNLYSERSPCHVILMPHEVFLADSYVFREVVWELQIWDQPWEFFFNSMSQSAPVASKGKSKGGAEKNSRFRLQYHKYQQMISSGCTAKRRLFSCDSLQSKINGSIPDVVELIFATFPTALGLAVAVYNSSVNKSTLSTAEIEHNMLLNSVRFFH